MSRRSSGRLFRLAAASPANDAVMSFWTRSMIRFSFGEAVPFEPGSAPALILLKVTLSSDYCTEASSIMNRE